MLKWCAYCQQFTGESPEYDDFSITHGLCGDCASGKLDLFSASTVEQADFLRDIFDRLFAAGRRNEEQRRKTYYDAMYARRSLFGRMWKWLRTILRF